MIIPGIWKAAQLRSPSRLHVLGRERPIAVTLYKPVAAGHSADKERQLELILRSFPTHTGTFKRTQAGRFDHFDRVAVDLVSERLDGAEVLRVHDMGVSDGRTAADFYELLSSHVTTRIEFLASDAFPDVVVVTDDRAPGLTLVMDGTGEELVQFIQPPFVFNASKPESRMFPLNRALRRLVRRTRVERMLKRYRRGAPGIHTEQILLLHPRCNQLVDNDDGFSFEKRNVLSPSKDRFDVVRAMNVLNHGYFSSSQLARAVANVFDSLRVDDGLFITGRNQDRDSPVQGSVYMRTSAGFEVVATENDGSEIDDIVAAHRGQG